MQIFISYSPKDRAYKAALLKSLTVLQQEGRINTWELDDLLPGEEKAKVIRTKIEEAKIILTLVSPDYLADQENYAEAQIAIERYRQDPKAVFVLPIIVRPCDWVNTPIANLPGVLLGDPEPLSSWEDLDRALLLITGALRYIIDHQTLPNDDAWETIENGLKKVDKLLEEAVELIGDGDLNTAFEKVQTYCERKKSNLYNELIMLKSRQNRLQNKVNKGIIRTAAQEAEQEKINETFLRFISNLQTS